MKHEFIILTLLVPKMEVQDNVSNVLLVNILPTLERFARSVRKEHLAKKVLQIVQNVQKGPLQTKKEVENVRSAVNQQHQIMLEMDATIIIVVMSLRKVSSTIYPP